MAILWMKNAISILVTGERFACNRLQVCPQQVASLFAMGN